MFQKRVFTPTVHRDIWALSIPEYGFAGNNCSISQLISETGITARNLTIDLAGSLCMIFLMLVCSKLRFLL